jgi:hypothetical protein
MHIGYYPNKQAVDDAQQIDDPLLMLVSFDGLIAIVACIDDGIDYSYLLLKMGYQDVVSEINRYFRVTVNQDGADWAFVCPSDYRNISDVTSRIQAFYDDGMILLSEAIKTIGYNSQISIPERYKRNICISIETSKSPIVDNLLLLIKQANINMPQCDLEQIREERLTKKYLNTEDS